MSRNRTLWLAAALAVILLAGVSLPAAAHPRRARVFFVDPLYWYDPFWYYPYGYNAYPMYRPAATTGGVELLVSPVTQAKAEVYVNGALAAEFGHKETLHLAPGEYRVEVRKAGYASQDRTVYVTAGHTLKLELELAKEG